MSEEYVMWGESPQQQKAPPPPREWSTTSDSYHTSYAATLKASLAIRAFAIPAVVWGIICYVMSEYLFTRRDEEGTAFVICILGYAVTAFIIWFKLAYQAYLFDNISKMARNTEVLIHKIDGMANLTQDTAHDANTQDTPKV